MLHNEIGQPLFSDKSLILTRHKTQQAPVHHIANGGNAWDTVKPLQKHFGELAHRVVLVDDDAYKVVPPRRLQVQVLTLNHARALRLLLSDYCAA